MGIEGAMWGKAKKGEGGMKEVAHLPAALIIDLVQGRSLSDTG